MKIYDEKSTVFALPAKVVDELILAGKWFEHAVFLLFKKLDMIIIRRGCGCI